MIAEIFFHNVLPGIMFVAMGYIYQSWRIRNLKDSFHYSIGIFELSEGTPEKFIPKLEEVLEQLPDLKMLFYFWLPMNFWRNKVFLSL